MYASEGLHDMKDHIAHVLQELPAHLDQDAKAMFNAFLNQEVNTHAVIRGSDYRKALLLLPEKLKGKVVWSVQMLINTLAELCYHLYATEADRTPRAILRLYNVAFLHARYCVKALFPPKVLTEGTAFGLYFHKLGIHAAEDTRTTSGYTRLVENDERQFKDLRAATTVTTRRPDTVAKQLVEAIQVIQPTIIVLRAYFV